MILRKADSVATAGKEMLYQPQKQRPTGPAAAVIFFSPFPLAIEHPPIPFKTRIPFPWYQEFISLDAIGESKVKDYAAKKT